MSLGSTQYRADIDGLRAIAVIAVLLFHCGLGVPGGFVGVDVFFVISGYLITRLITSDLERGTFSLARFWERRIRRIWPASLAVTIATLAAGWFLLLPRDYRSLADDALAQVAMVANVRYWLSVFYFGIASEVRPLLHTWSLAVEEQFYVVYPLVMIASWRAGRRWCGAILAALACVSLVASVLLLENRGSFVFYMLPFRAWEMLLGGLLAIAPPARARPRWVTECLGGCGALLVVLPTLLYGRQTPFPGLHAVPPCLGAALVIAAGVGPNRSAINRLLAAPPLRAIGLVSYSLYLWHWPVLALLRYSGGGAVVEHRLPVVLAAIGLLAVLSWRFIEQPFRRSTIAAGSIRWTAISAGLVSAVVAACCLWIHHTNGVPSRFSPAIRRLLAHADVADARARFSPRPGSAAFPPIGTESPDGRPCLFIWGDSHAFVISPVIDSLARDLGIAGEIAFREGVPPLPDVWKPNATFNRAASRRLAQEWADQVVDRIRTSRPRHVILCGRWSSYLLGGRSMLEDNTIASLDSTDTSATSALATMATGIRRMRQVCADSGAELWLFTEVPDQSAIGQGSIQQRALSWHWTGRPPSLAGVSREAHDRQQRAVRDVVHGAAGQGIHLVDLAAPFFGEDGLSLLGRGESLWYADDNHVTATGASDVLEPLLRDVLTRIRASCDGPAPITSAPPPP